MTGTASTSEIVGLLRRHPTWQDASDATLRSLAGGTRVVDASPGQVFVVEGQPPSDIHLLLSGAVRVFFPAKKGRPEVTHKLMQAPGAWGDIACVMRIPYTATVQAIAPSRTLAVEAQRYFDALQREPLTCFRQYWDMTRRFGFALEMERAAFTATIHERVVALLLAYADQVGRRVDEGVLIDAALSQDDIAEQVGSNRRSIVRIMEQLYATGGLVRIGRKYAITDRDKLLASVQGVLPNFLGKLDVEPWALKTR